MKKATVLLVVLLLGVWTSNLQAAAVDGLGEDDPAAAAEQGEAWQDSKSLKEAIEYLFVHKVGADVTFTVTHEDGPSRGVPIVFKAHRTILMARSSVMFDTFINSPSVTADTIAVTGIDPQAFSQMLRYMYTENPEISRDNVMYVAYAARAYQMPGLQQLCGEFLQNDLNSDTALGILQQAVFFDDVSLISKCLEVIARAGSDLFTSTDFLELPADSLSYIVGMETVNSYEVELFRACLQWAQAEVTSKNHTDVREALKPVIHKIRFPAMSLKEFTEDVVSSGVLTVEEVATIYQQIISDTPPPGSPFISDNRGKPVEYPGELVLSGETEYVSQRYDTGLTCFVNANVTLSKLTSVAEHSLYSDELSIEQNGGTRITYLRNKVASYHPGTYYTYSLSSSVDIMEGTFKLKINRDRYSSYSRSVFESSPEWQQQHHGSVEWWCNSTVTSIFGFEYKVTG